MKRLFSVFTIIIIFLSVTCAVLSYQNSSLNNQMVVLEDQLSECQNQNLQCENQVSELESQFDQLTQLATIKNTSIVVRVTDFTTPGFSPTVGTWVESYANITIQNLGTNDLEGLTLTIDNPDDYPSGSVPKSLKIESLNAGEERTVSTNVYWALGAGVRVMISIKLDDIILDEYSTY
jgi:hypothetical protein